MTVVCLAVFGPVLWHKNCDLVTPVDEEIDANLYSVAAEPGSLSNGDRVLNSNIGTVNDDGSLASLEEWILHSLDQVVRIGRWGHSGTYTDWRMLLVWWHQRLLKDGKCLNSLKVLARRASCFEPGPTGRFGSHGGIRLVAPIPTVTLADVVGKAARPLKLASAAEFLAFGLGRGLPVED